ncbi:hypothetical protein BS50DRAFT_72795 [Corynespora cassiicola Philippines]|uniref:WW domain-containing protein n=1 Tax=Corynespora cassiicola Philippines TaxID=1448308 RepID=A0A2T2NGK9_CORCC|nr:hypothetical protein BS50DRAFT_72795 [Corynespora cassiicola Philippines]
MTTPHPQSDHLEPPPSYETATASSGTSSPQRLSTDAHPSSRTPRNGIPNSHRRSMEDEHRPLPPGWIRTFDPIEQHQFFVDTRANPPRSIWVHPYDDDNFVASLPEGERERARRLRRSVTLEDVGAESSDDEAGTHHHANTADGVKKVAGDPAPRGLHKYTRALKDSLTHTTHSQRAEARARRAEQERAAYIAHLRAREALVRALQTGEPQLLGRDERGMEVYIVPPGVGTERVPRGALGWSPYVMGRGYGRPGMPYGRAGGVGYGGGLGVPVAAGLLGGVALGGLMF